MKGYSGVAMVLIFTLIALSYSVALAEDNNSSEDAARDMANVTNESLNATNATELEDEIGVAELKNETALNTTELKNETAFNTTELKNETAFNTTELKNETELNAAELQNVTVWK